MTEYITCDRCNKKTQSYGSHGVMFRGRHSSVGIKFLCPSCGKKYDQQYIEFFKNFLKKKEDD